MLARKKILFVDNDVRTFVSHRLALAKSGVTAGLDVHLAAPRSKEAPMLAQHGVSYHQIPLSRSGMAPWREVMTIFALLRLYRSLRPDIVHHLRIKPVLYGGIAARLSGIPVVVVSALTGLGHLFRTQTTVGRVARQLVLLGLRVAFGGNRQRVIFQNPDDRKYCVSKGICSVQNTVVIRGSGVDMSAFTHQHEPPTSVPMVMLASRLLWEKGIGEFVEAAKALKGEGIMARFALVGDPDPGNPSSVSVAQLRAWSAQGVVEWWGWRSDMQAVIRQSHIVCLPSYGEGVPRVLIEAAASGRPIVTTDTPGCREIVRDGVNGFLVPERDVPALANALRFLLIDDKLRATFGQNGREIAVREFSIERVTRETFEVYRHLIATVNA
jgi:glycosyltransferase involved in cell wall biosynthesis